METMPLLLLDYYKTTHQAQYPKGITKLVSYLTPRMSRVHFDKIVQFGVQYFVKEYLIDYFNKNFFNKDKGEVLAEYDRILGATIGKGTYNLYNIAALHDLGYLPIQIRAIPEGTIVPMKVPVIEIMNTHPDFAWLVNTIETLMSCTLWHGMVSANVGYMYRQIANKYYAETVEDDVPVNRAMGDFSMRGQESLESATISSAGWLLSFVNTATVPAIPFMEKYYNCDCTKEPVGFGAVSTEHSVMCSNAAVDGDEITFVKRALTEIYPNTSFSMVSDSYDYWNMVSVILPQCKKEIMEHNGVFLVRPDSGNPVDIICGTLKRSDYMIVDGLTDNVDDIKNYFAKLAEEDFIGFADYIWYQVRIGDNLYTVKCYYASEPDEEGECNLTPTVYPFDVEVNCKKITPAMKGTVECLWEIFGGNVNSKGYKVLDKHIRVVYGDSITIQRAEEIYSRLKEKGFAANNVSLGVGSFSMQCIEEDGQLKPFTRDSYSIAVKSTYAEVDGKPIMIFKNPKTDDGHFKKSQRGMCVVCRDKDGNITYRDGLTFEQAEKASVFNMMNTVFKNGQMVKDSLSDIRNRLHEGKF